MSGRIIVISVIPKVIYALLKNFTDIHFNIRKREKKFTDHDFNLQNKEKFVWITIL